GAFPAERLHERMFRYAVRLPVAAEKFVAVGVEHHDRRTFLRVALIVEFHDMTVDAADDRRSAVLETSGDLSALLFEIDRSELVRFVCAGEIRERRVRQPFSECAN